MSKIYERIVESHHNIYTGEARTIEYSIALPDSDIDNNTGVLVLSYGYGGYYNSNIFNKLMHTLPNQYNLAVLNCKFFGSDFLKQTSVRIDLEGDFDALEKNGYYELPIEGEDEHNFNDMSIMQAIDHVYATIDVLKFLGEDYSKRHVFIFGSSHGGYLAHLANLLCPNLYTAVIDISSYTYPYYLNNIRQYGFSSNCIQMLLGFQYYINQHPEYQLDDDLLSLYSWYKSTNSNCKVLAFHGKSDWMVNYKEKQSFIKSIGPNADIALFSPEDVDGTLIKNDNHGLGMDFSVLFEMIIPTLLKGNCTRDIYINDSAKSFVDNKITINYSDGVPTITKISKKHQD